ncbi:MAG TPA: hypothetical protein VET46_03350 [Steroidobacteraceae bacterium]|nr:hypothetical protein [Steroidobacteraceae bacterium]
MSSAKVLAWSIALCCALTGVAGSALAQQAPQKIAVTAADRAAASGVRQSFISAFTKGTQAGTGKLRSDVLTLTRHSGGAGGGFGDQTQFPGDLGFLGGATIAAAVQHPIYLIPTGSPCSAANPLTCWGNVSQFIADLGTSPLIHITDQYVGARADNRYPLGTVFQVSYTPQKNPFTDADMQAVAHAAALAQGKAGYGQVFHIFLVPGQDECFDSTFTVCASNVFCAYHSSAVFPDVGEVVYSVEPNVVGVLGCNPQANSPNGPFDATYSVLSHETIELITDPDGTAWFNITDSGLLGSEIGDECLFWLFDAQGNFISTNDVLQVFHGRPYQIQTEYNNAAHSCTTRAFDF